MNAARISKIMYAYHVLAVCIFIAAIVSTTSLTVLVTSMGLIASNASKALST